MSRETTRRALGGAAAALVALLLLAGCAYDYLQHTDRVSYRAGDAVKANIEAQTTDPSKRSAYSTRGLGRNGEVIPETEDTE